MYVRTEIDYLDLSREINKLPSDYALAKKLNISQPDVAKIRTGKKRVNEYIANQLAESIGVETMEILASKEYWKESNEEKKKYWLQIYKKNKTKNQNMESLADFMLKSIHEKNQA